MGITEERHTKKEYVYIIRNPAKWNLLFLIISIIPAAFIALYAELFTTAYFLFTTDAELDEPSGVVFKAVSAILFIVIYLSLNQVFAKAPEIFYRKIRASRQGKKVSDSYTDKGLSGWASTRIVRIQK